MKQTLRPGAIGLGALVSLYALLTQFTATGPKTHTLLVGALYALCVILFERASARLTLRSAVWSLVWGGLMAMALLMGAGARYYFGPLPKASALSLLVRLGGLALFFAALPAWYLGSTWRPGQATASRLGNRGFFLLAWAMILAGWLPYFLTMYPGILSSDSMAQVQQVVTGAYDNWNPIFHTLVLALAIKVGDLVGLAHVHSLGFFIAAQMLLMSGLMAYTALFLRQRAGSGLLAPLAVLVAMLHPIHGYFAVTLWKDIPFSGAVLLLTLMTWRIMESRGEALKGRRFQAAFIAVLLLVCFLRNNGAPAALATLVGLMVALKAARPYLAKVLSGVLALFFLVQGPLFAALGLKGGEVAEALAVPLQQVGAIVAKEKPLTAAERDLIDRVMPVETMAQAYSYLGSNSLKFNPQFNNAALGEDLPAYGKLWLSLISRYPGTALAATVWLSGGFYTLDMPVSYTYYPNSVSGDWQAQLYNRDLIPGLKAIRALEPGALAARFPMFSAFIHPAMLVWVLLLALCILAATRRRQWIPLLLPGLSVFVMLLLGAPLAEMRYIYPLMLCLPVYVALMLGAKGNLLCPASQTPEVR